MVQLSLFLWSTSQSYTNDLLGEQQLIHVALSLSNVTVLHYKEWVNFQHIWSNWDRKWSDLINRSCLHFQQVWSTFLAQVYLVISKFKGLFLNTYLKFKYHAALNWHIHVRVIQIWKYSHSDLGQRTQFNFNWKSWE